MGTGKREARIENEMIEKDQINWKECDDSGILEEFEPVEESE